ncbi:MAG TPA: pre-peptidase C-terminal domain-containing protein [Myxococcota bacterium]|nr:pre-peptidase C-terminal domain-containing protein [Myxococcota bacterium]
MSRLFSVPLLLALACAPEPAAPADPLAALSGDALAPPPAPATLTATPFVSGMRFTLSVRGQPPGTVMTVIASTNTTGPGLCPPAISPTCLDIANPYVTLGSATTDATGVATLNLTAPATVPPRVEVQAYGVRSGTYYLSNGVMVTGYAASGDADGDGLTNGQELTRGTGITDSDSDDDGLRDGAEVSGGLDPRDPDVDDDGLLDGEELAQGTNPRDPDSDDDTLSDGQEVSAGTDPLRADTDSDGLSDADEVSRGTDPTQPDTDQDGLSDGAELSGGTDPLDPDSDDDGVGDGDELTAGTDPLMFDTDGDGLGDDELAAYGTDPLDPDTDGGGVSDGDEVSRGTDPTNGADDIPAVCGNGILEAGEDCDDHNIMNGDGCPANCQFLREAEPNDSGATANGPFVAPGSIHHAIDPIGDVDWLAFIVPAYADLRIETTTSAGDCPDPMDTLIDLYASTNLTTPLATDDDDGQLTCSLLQPSADAAVRHVAPGTYYVRVRDYAFSGNGDETIADVRTQITFDALCGDGVTAGSEECDGGPTCAMDCQRIQVCGDGFLDAPETCDDGNTSSGDGCSATCTVEGVMPEVEPNDSIAAADATGQLITGPVVYAAAANPIGDRDYFKVGQFTTARVVTFETFENSAANDCLSTTFTTALNLVNPSNINITSDTGIATAGIRSCSALSFPLDANTTYYIEAEESGRNAVLAAYYLRAEFPPGIGAEVEPNDTQSTATTLTGASGWISGGHQLTADLDWYSITVPTGSSLRLEVIEGNRATETCESNGIDALITLYNSVGTPITSDDDDGRGYCSLLDGTGSASQLDPLAHALAGGTYYIQVKAAVTTAGASQFDYKLLWKVRTP